MENDKELIAYALSGKYQRYSARIFINIFNHSKKGVLRFVKNKCTLSKDLSGDLKKTNDSMTLLEQWKTCVDMANTVSQRRDTMNNWFITLNIGMFVTLSTNYSIKCILGSLLGIVLCFIWLGFIKNYKRLNTEKFKIINDIEKKLPEQPFNLEWNELNKHPKYIKCTTLESCLAWMFIAIYILLLAFSTPNTGDEYVIQYFYKSFMDLFRRI